MSEANANRGGVISRRGFVRGLGGGAICLAGGRLFAAPSSGAVLSGSEFDLEISSLAVNFTGRARLATAVNGQIPAPLLRWREGDLIRVRVRNRLPVPTSIHWHGVLVPANMDGVPGLSFDGIAPGTSFTYEFRAQQSGTYWYHSHSRFQEQTGLYGPIIIEPAASARPRIERDHTILLSDWTDEDPEHLYATLKRDSEYFNFSRRTVGDFVRDARAQGLRAALAERRMWGEARMDPTDLADVSGHTYTYLMNGVPPEGNWSGEFARGDRVRLRFINGSSMSFFDVRIPGLPMRVVSADGQEVEPVTVDEFRIGAGEVYDVIVQPAEEEPYAIFAQSMDRSGFACGTLTPRAGLRAASPPMDARDELSGADMGMMMSTGPMMAMPARAARTSSAVGVDMHVASPDERLDDPGVGLRGNGRRVLTYADLHTVGGPVDERAPEREIELHLTGHMRRYIWSFDGRKFSEATPLEFRQGERLRLVLVNDSMMTHPIHLHGMWGELEAPGGGFQVRKRTIVVRPAQKLSYCVSAMLAGRWAYHCHLLYHMEAGMFREVAVRSAGPGVSSP